MATSRDLSGTSDDNEEEEEGEKVFNLLFAAALDDLMQFLHTTAKLKRRRQQK